MLKIYVHDKGVYGMTVVVSDSLDNALKLINEQEVYQPGKVTVEEIEIKEIANGLIVANYGDQ